MPLRRSPTSRQLLTGALGGLVGTAAMTAAMRRMHGYLPEAERYGSETDRKLLQDLAASDPESYVRKHAQRRLASLKGKK